jgi:hypothetical protein
MSEMDAFLPGNPDVSKFYGFVMGCAAARIAIRNSKVGRSTKTDVIVAFGKAVGSRESSSSCIERLAH